ncbi:MAG: hypothetical protein KF715_04975 [Candidatus Didemnitutus sp.]|nr:hypothetical protein [Candidatus Didemnitutus sp.]
MRNGHFTLRWKEVQVRLPGSARTVRYGTWLLRGWLAGRRIRKQFADEAEARGAKQRFEIQAANTRDDVRTVVTRLSTEQLAEAEAAHRMLKGGHSLAFAVEWFNSNYRPAVASRPLSEAVTTFLAERAPHLSFYVARDYRRELASLQAAFPSRDVSAVTTADVQRYMDARKLGRKGWNNLRGELHAFFEWCRQAPRSWCAENSAAPLPKFKIARGLPEILSAQQVAEFMAFVEDYAGGPRSDLPRGCLVPYFALCVFAGIRPTVPRGEVCRLGRLPPARLARAVDLANGVINIEPDISKTHDLRQIKIRANLQAWLERYPLKKFPIVLPNIQKMVTEVRTEFLLSDDVLRHTFISMHVAKFHSLGAAALEAGNSEAIIKRHYLNLVTERDAEAFWQILPR